MVRFQCILCGECCEWYWIPLTHLDMLRLKIYGKYILRKIVDLKDISEANRKDEFIIEVEDDKYYLSLSRNENLCIFLKDGKCLVHRFKPLVCRFYPFIYVVEKYGDIRIEVNDEAIGKCPGLKIDSKIIPKDIKFQLKRLAKIRILELEFWKKTIKSWNETMGRKHDLNDFIEFSINKAQMDMKELLKWNLWVM